MWFQVIFSWIFLNYENWFTNFNCQYLFDFSEKVAAKILDKGKLDEKTQRLLSREITSMERLHHPNIIRIFEVLETYSKIYMIVEFASGGELFHKIVNEGKFTEQLAKVYFAQIISAVSHMVRNIFTFVIVKMTCYCSSQEIRYNWKSHIKFCEEVISFSEFLFMCWQNCGWRITT